MPNKYILFLTFIILFGCSKDDSVDLSNAINIFQSKTTISFVNKNERENGRHCMDIIDEAIKLIYIKGLKL